jgi:ketosteroid isomerase-like protein
MAVEVSEGGNMTKKSVFGKRFAMLVFLFSVSVWWASVGIKEGAAMPKAGRAAAPSKDPAAVDTIKQLEQDMGNAMVAGDIDKLNQIYADDFATVGSSGKVITKETLLNDFKSFHDKLEWFENGPMDVRVFGDVAVACASVKEKRIRNGKDTSGEFVWTDLIEERAGKWVVVRSAGTRLK